MEELFKMPTTQYGIIELFGQSVKVSLCNEFGETTQSWHKDTKLQKNHHRGGQSQNRIARLRLESIHNYLKSIAEQSTRMFTQNGKPSIEALLIVGNSVKKEQIREYFTFQVPLIIQTMEEYNKNTIQRYFKEMIVKVTNCDEQYLDQLRQTLQMEMDKLTFGVDETMEAFQKHELQRIFVTQNVNSNSKCQVCIFQNADLLKQYGGMVGVRYVSVS